MSFSEGLSTSDSGDVKPRKSLRSAVITDNDPLKIKLKISKRDIVEPSKTKKDSDGEAKHARNLRNSLGAKPEVRNSEEKLGEEMMKEDKMNENSMEKKMKLRPRKETEDEMEGRKDDAEEMTEEKKKPHRTTEEFASDSNDADKPPKKRGRPCKAPNEEGEEKESKRRSRRIEGNEEDKSTEGGDVSTALVACLAKNLIDWAKSTE